MTDRHFPPFPVITVLSCGVGFATSLIHLVCRRMPLFACQWISFRTGSSWTSTINLLHCEVDGSVSGIYCFRYRNGYLLYLFVLCGGSARVHPALSRLPNPPRRHLSAYTAAVQFPGYRGTCTGSGEVPSLLFAHRSISC